MAPLNNSYRIESKKKMRVMQVKMFQTKCQRMLLVRNKSIFFFTIITVIAAILIVFY